MAAEVTRDPWPPLGVETPEAVRVEALAALRLLAEASRVGVEEPTTVGGTVTPKEARAFRRRQEAPSRTA